MSGERPQCPECGAHMEGEECPKCGATSTALRLKKIQEELIKAHEANKLLLGEKLREEATRADARMAGEELRRIFYTSDEEEGQFKPMRFVNYLLEAYPGQFATPANDMGGDVIWRYNAVKGIWEPDGVPWAEQQLQAILGEAVTTGIYTETVKHLQVATYTDPETFTENPHVVALLNGALNSVTREFTPHSPAYKAKTRLPVTYDPDADCPTIKAFLRRVAGDSLPFLQEWTGYHLLKDYRFQRCVVLVGEGDNGKSTLLSLLTVFLGTWNVTGQSLYRLSSNRFASAELYFKLANIAADIGPDELRHTGTLKMLTGGDWITAERKNRDPFKYMNYAKLSFSCNQLPRTPDETLAFYKRFIVVLFSETIPRGEQDPTLLEKMTTPCELSGLLNWALEGLDRLLRQGGFTEAGTALERRELYKRMSDPVTGFVNDCVEEDPEAWVEKQEVLAAFAGYCRDRGFIPCSDKKFLEDFKKQVYCREFMPKVGGRQVRALRGIRLCSYTRGTQDTRVPQTPALEKFSVGEDENPVYGVYPVSGGGAGDENPGVDHLKRVAEGYLRRVGYSTRVDFFNFMFEAGHRDMDVVLGVLERDPRYEFTGGGVRWGEVKP